jgi:SAM-dependent methyltransferase
MAEQNEKIRDEVRNYYRNLAQEQKSSCCEPSDCSCGPSYPDELLAGIPRDIAGFSMGCGDPISIAELQPGETVLDLGSGGGLDCFMAAKLVGPKGRVIGVDMTDEMLAHSTQKAAEIGLENVEFRRGLIEDIPAEDQSIDVIISNCVINLSPDKPAVLVEAFRILRGGGRFVVSDIVTRGEMQARFREIDDSWSACIAGAPTVDEYQAMLASAGFADIEVKAIDGAPLDRIPLGVPFSAIIRARKSP